MRFLFVAIVGLLPLWAAILYFLYALMTMPGDHAAMTLWFLVLAIPACGVSLPIAGGTIMVESLVSGDAARKKKGAIVFFAGCILALAVAAQYQALEKKKREHRQRAELIHVQQFVLTHDAVREAAGSPLQVASPVGSAREPSAMPFEYEVAVTGSARKLYAIVRPNRRKQPASFVLACTTPLDSWQRDSSADACGKPRRQPGSWTERVPQLP